MQQLIDLTLTLRRGMRGVDWNDLHTVPRDGWNTRILHLYSHAGTHMDAQTHFAAGQETIDTIPLEKCLGPAWVADIPGLAPRALIEVSHLEDVADKLRTGESLLLRTGWSKHVDNPNCYRDGLPRISEALAQWCAARRLSMLGVEPPSVADVNNVAEITRIHQILLAGGVTIVEGLTNLDRIRRQKILFGALPLKIEGGDGCPCRAFAIENVAWLGC